MERPYIFKITKIFQKMIPERDKTKEPTYLSKRVKGQFLCDLDNITFIDFCVKDNGEQYKNKCAVTIEGKGEIVIDHSLEEVSKLVNRVIVIKGFKG